MGAHTTAAAVLRQEGWRVLPHADVGGLLRAEDGLVQARRELEWPTPSREVVPVGQAEHAPVVTTARKIVCCGHNYRAHILEMGREIPAHPTLFTKFADTLAGPYDPVEVPEWAGGLDWEAELAVVVGESVYRADKSTAVAAVAGYTAANDLSVREWQHHTSQWLPGKAFDGTTPLGPVLVTPDEFDPCAGIEISCHVNGDTVQRADTADLVFDAGDLIAYASQFTRLGPGDVVLTGTPAGVGTAGKPPRSLADGDVVEVRVAGIGTLRNKIRLLAQTPIH
ncbi:fumarylacetoacetate hydrolase family protein [Amycolatopsis sp. TRM77291]